MYRLTCSVVKHVEYSGIFDAGANRGCSLGGKYRVGDYRVMASIEDAALKILVIRIGNRREVYR